MTLCENRDPASEPGEDFAPRVHGPSSRVLLLLALPAFWPLVFSSVAAWSQGKVATGFIQPDNPYYVASGREHFDQGFQLTYGNPYAGYNTPAIYFQPQILLLGCLVRLGLDPGVAINVFWIAALFLTVWVGARLWVEVAGWGTTAKKLGLLCFFWGGGVLSLAGVAVSFFIGHLGYRSPLVFDPENGWWLLNFGRNLVKPLETYYHGLYLLCILLLIRKQFGKALAVAALLSISHPFTGLELALVLVVFSAAELMLRSDAARPGFLAGCLAILLLHLGYYLLFLNRFEDHRVLQSQWDALEWLYFPWTYVPALYTVAVFVFIRFSRWSALRDAFRDPRTRLFALWFLVVFALSQHNLVMNSHQPIHFAHGYDWIALFLLGWPAMQVVINRLLAIRMPAVRTAAVALFLALILSDNLFWFASYFTPAQHYAIVLTPDQKAVLNCLDQKAAPPDMVVSEDGTVGYLVSTYTRVRSWYGHQFDTPHAQQHWSDVEAAFREGKVLREWQSMHVYYVGFKSMRPPVAGAAEVFHDGGFRIWESSQWPVKKAGYPADGSVWSRK